MEICKSMLGYTWGISKYRGKAGRTSNSIIAADHIGILMEASLKSAKYFARSGVISQIIKKSRGAFG